jgi:FkbM family methyltransferase
MKAWSFPYLPMTKANKLLHALESFGPNFKLTFLDIGCAGGAQNRWNRIAQKTFFIGIDASNKVYPSDFSKSFKDLQLILGKALGNPANKTKTDTYYATNHPLAGSLLKPNYSFFDRFPKSYKFQIAESIPTEVIRLSELDLRVDFVKMDVQGGELEILKGCSNQFYESLLGLEVECEFQELYENQPLFGDISKYLTNLNFELIDFVNPTRWLRDRPNKYFGQMIASDVLFLKQPHYFFSNKILSETKWREYLSILLLFERHDLLDHSKTYLTKQQQSEARKFFIFAEIIKNQDYIIWKIIYLSNWFLRKLGSEKRIFLFS